MLATRWEPLSQMNRLRQEMDRLFDQWGENRWQQFSQGGFPPLNLWEDDEQLYVEAELPGLELKDLEITVAGGNQLHIKGERRAPEHQGGSWYRRERAFGPFERVILLPNEVDSERVSAEFKNGVLMVTLARREEAKPRRITVKSG